MSILMNSVRIHGRTIMTKWDKPELTRRTAEASGVIKTTLGVTNNAAWAATLEAHDHVKKSKRYRETVKKAYLDTIDAFRCRERKLVYAEKNRLFHLADLLPEHRKRYGDITDTEYYEYWCSTGQTAYCQTRSWVMNIRNKYQQSLSAHGVAEAEIVSWAMEADACLRLAQVAYANITELCADEFDVPLALLHDIFGALDMTLFADKWTNAMRLLVPETETYTLSDFETKNIQYGLDQLMDQWMSLDTIKSSVKETISSYDNIFRTKGEMKKALREVSAWDKD